jgi:hypothetical protein
MRGNNPTTCQNPYSPGSFLARIKGRVESWQRTVFPHHPDFLSIRVRCIITRIQNRYGFGSQFRYKTSLFRETHPGRNSACRAIKAPFKTFRSASKIGTPARRRDKDHITTISRLNEKVRGFHLPLPQFPDSCTQNPWRGESR